MGEPQGSLGSLLTQARRAAQRRGQPPTTAHLLLVMLQGDEETSELLGRHGVGESALLAALRDGAEEPERALDVAMERARRIADALGEAARPLHMLLAVTKDPRTAAHRCLAHLVRSVEALRDDARGDAGHGRAKLARSSTTAAIGARRSARAPARPVGSAARQPTPPRARRAPPGPVEESMRIALSAPEAPPVVDAAPPGLPAAANDEASPWALDPERYPILAALGRNLSELAAAGRLDPVIGRDAEMEQILDALARRRANNPILVGPSGVGKTAVVEGVAARLLREEDPSLRELIVLELSAGALVSGTSVRGALAERMKRIREEIRRDGGRVVLFIDEIHAVVAGGDGPDDLSQELKSTLARGEITCIGATTDAEYRKHFEKDPALARRFSPVRIGEPSPEVATRILEGLAPKYELHHGVAYDADVFAAAVAWSVRYLSEKQLPDKAISVMDLAAARARRRNAEVVDVAQVAAVIAELAQVPVERILERDAERLLRLESVLAERIVGHVDLIARVSDALRKSAAGFRGKRPLGTFLLLGPTGVGKTELAKAVAESLFPKGAMTRLDMSEFSEAHAVARLLGAPPGYIGHDDGGQLTEAVRRRPYQVVLLDEVEKAHPDVLLALLPMLDEGRLTDARGRLVDFTNTIIFMTSNLGADAATSRSIGFGGGSGGGDASKGRTQASLDRARGAMPPELWNRIDEPLAFGPLSEDDVREIARRMLVALGTRVLEERGVRIAFDATVPDALIRAGGFDPVLGARPMRRVLGRVVEAPLAQRLLSGEVPRGALIVLRGADASVDFLVEAEAAE